MATGRKYHQISVTPEDAQFLETRRFHVTDIARWFGVPPHKIGDLDRATNNNIEQQALEFVQETLGPMAERWEASIEAELLFDDEDLEAEFQFSQLMRGDSQSRATFYNMGIQSGWLTRNEARIAENLNPLPGLDQPLRPLNMAEEGQNNPLPPQNSNTPRG
ncbi:MAG: phage portal protein [Burkholderiales bacterium 21-58-4]|nr:MAG: phage portal protein [Burkholderiales bacterium 21-58-4]